MAPMNQIESRGLVEQTAEQLRAQVIAGDFRPGQRLSEAQLSAGLSVSRNTLREVYRLLTREGLLRHEPNRGVSVSVPSMASVLDIYRVRRLIELPALAQGWPRHPAIGRMAAAVNQAEAARACGDWQGVGSANMIFHSAIVALTDSPRVIAFFAQVIAELRLAFGLLDSPEQLHAPFLTENGAIMGLLEDGDTRAASKRLADYLARSERVVMTAFARLESGTAKA